MKYECPECHKEYGLTKEKKHIICPWCGSKIKVEAKKVPDEIKKSLATTTKKRKIKRGK